MPAGNNIPSVVSGADDFDFWRDPFPQWVMAIFTIVATGISLYAIRLVRATWHATEATAQAAIEANRTAKEIGEKQVKAYLTCTGATFGLTDDAVWIVFEVKNVGQSPAKWAEVEVQLVLVNQLGATPPLVNYNLGSGRSGAIMTGLVGKPFVSSQSASPVPVEALRRALDTQAVPFLADCILKWEDVFGGVDSIPFTVMEDQDTAKREATSNGGRRLTGTMSASNNTAAQQTRKNDSAA